jgi:hypothetical protein
MSTTTEPTAAAPADRSTDLVNRLLKLPDEVKLDLARLLTDSVREGFTSLADGEKKQKELIRSRLEAFDRGELKATDWRESLARVEQQVRESRS